MRINESSLATIAGILTSAGVALAMFTGPEYEIPVYIKMAIALLPLMGGVLTKSFHSKKEA